MRAAALLLAFGLVATACGLTTEPTTTSTSRPGVSATTTTTTTIVGGGGPTTGPPSTPPPAAGYSLDMRHEISSGYATVELHATSCTGLEGPWNGSFQVHMDAEGMVIDGGGPLDFTLRPGETVTGEALYGGSGYATDADCLITDVTDPLGYEFTLDPSGPSVDVVFGSRGGGSITIACGTDPPISIPFAIAWGPEPLTVPLTPLDSCP